MTSSEGCLIDKQEVCEFIKNCCKASGVQDEHSSVLADVLVAADYRGHYSHALKNLGPVVGRFCMDLAIKKAKDTAIGLVSARGSNHFEIGWYGVRVLDHGLIGLTFTSTGAGMAPTRARQNVLGTNPICVAAPANDGDSFVLDMATATVSFGKVALAEKKGERIPESWAVDKDGKDTVDPAEMYGIHPLG